MSSDAASLHKNREKMLYASRQVKRRRKTESGEQTNRTLDCRISAESPEPHLIDGTCVVNDLGLGGGDTSLDVDT
jgi:hypothetical protein